MKARRFGLRQNAAFNIGAKGFSILTSLFSAPFIIDHVGLTAFGFWALVSSLSQYAGLLDFGVGPALTRYVAELHSLGDHEGLTRKGTAGLYIALAYAVVIVACTGGFCLLLPEALTGNWPDGWKWALLGVGVSLAGSTVSSTFTAFPGGLARWDLQNVPLIVFQIVFLAAIIILLSVGAGLAGLGIATAIASVAMVPAAWLTSRLVWRQRWLSTGPVRRDLKTLFRYGLNLQLANLVLVINVQSDKPILLLFGGSLKFIAFYELASRVAFQLRSLPVMVLPPLTARAASVTAGHPVTVLRGFYEQSLTQIVNLGVAPLFAVFGACWPLVLAWLGHGFTTTAWITVILGAGYAVNLVTGAGTALAAGCGRPELDRNYSLLGLGLNIVLTLILGHLFGPWGVISATALGVSMSSIWLLYSMDRWVGTRTFSRESPLRSSGRPVLVGLVCGGTTITLVAVLLPTASRWLCCLYGVMSLLLFGIVWGVVTPQAKSVAIGVRQWLLAMKSGPTSPTSDDVLGG